MQEKFLTIKEEISAELQEKKSRFIANIFYVETEEEASQKLAQIKKTHHDAKHNVYAFRLSSGLEKYSDDGEPSGTAGVPILDILRGENLSNVLIVVTRYFGGILLGTGGLVRCYGGSAKQALENAKRVEMKLCTEYEVCTEYENYNSLLYYFNKNNIKVLENNFEEKIKIIVLVENTNSDNFLHDLSEITNRNCNINKIKSYYHG